MEEFQYFLWMSTQLSNWTETELNTELILKLNTELILKLNTELNVCVCSSVISDILQPHELQHTRLPWPTLSPRVCSNSCPLNRWCHPTILSSGVPFFSCPQSLPASGSSNELSLCIKWPKYWSFMLQHPSFQMITWGLFPLGLTGLISLLSKVLSTVFSSTKFRKHQFFSAHTSLWSNFHICTWLLEKP